MKKEPKDTLLACGVFMCVIIAWTVLILAVVYSLYGGIPTDKSLKFIWWLLIMGGYFFSFRWLVRRLRAIGTK